MRCGPTWAKIQLVWAQYGNTYHSKKYIVTYLFYNELRDMVSCEIKLSLWDTWNQVFIFETSHEKTVKVIFTVFLLWRFGYFFELQKVLLWTFKSKNVWSHGSHENMLVSREPNPYYDVRKRLNVLINNLEHLSINNP